MHEMPSLFSMSPMLSHDLEKIRLDHYSLTIFIFSQLEHLNGYFERK
ncbi:MAG: hypothetical protein ACTSVC_08510 [Promethearchaeota archaeon]